MLDEPTASLPAAEVDRLFSVLRMVHRQGVALIYVSHHFGEVFEISERITVLRDGAVVSTEVTEELDESQLIELTIGRALSSLEAIPEERPGVEGAEQEPALRLRSLGGEIIRRLDLDVAPGEIVGFAGVTGSGREEIAGLIFGGNARTGQVFVEGVEVSSSRPDLSMRSGMAFVPADRLANATFLDMTLRENTTISRMAPFCGLIGIDRAAERTEADVWLRKLEVVPPRPEAIIATLSGGNQQKVVLARALRLEPRALVLDSPTQGVDVGSKQSIHTFIREAAALGAAVVIASPESEELSLLCDRVVVLVGGEVRAIRPRNTTADELTELTLRAQPGRAEGALAGLSRAPRPRCEPATASRVSKPGPTVLACHGSPLVEQPDVLVVGSRAGRRACRDAGVHDEDVAAHIARVLRRQPIGAALAMSEASPGRPASGESLASKPSRPSMSSGSPTSIAAAIDVAMVPGAMAFTRMPKRHNSLATFFVKPITALLAAV